MAMNSIQAERLFAKPVPLDDDFDDDDDDFDLDDDDFDDEDGEDF